MRLCAALSVSAAVALLPAALLLAQVPAGGEFQVNTETWLWQARPSVALAAAGGFVVVWEGDDGASYGIHGQTYDAAGVQTGSEFRVNTYTTGRQWNAKVALDEAGNFVVVWISDGQDGSGRGVFGRRFDALARPRGPEFSVNQYTTGLQGYPTVASDAAGAFIVLWESDWQDGDGAGVFGRRYDAAGDPRGSEARLSSVPWGSQWQPSVALSATGDFVVAWSSVGGTGYGNTEGVVVRRFDTNGVPRGAEQQVSAQFGGRPGVSADAAGNFVVAWAMSGGNGWGDVFARRYDASGAPLGAEFRVNTYTTDTQYQPTVVRDAGGDFVVVWQGLAADGTDVFLKRYDALGSPRGSEVQVNTFTTGPQRFSSASSDKAGNFVVCWNSYEQDGSSSGIFAQRFGGLQPAALAVDAASSSGSDGNRVLEAGESTVAVAPSWRNVNGATQTFAATGLRFTGPAATGVSYALSDGTGDYGTVANGATAACSDCYQVGVALGGTRPATHWDATFSERITPDALGQTMPWSIHVGESFGDVPKTSPYYRFVETLLHKGVTGGCAASSYCPANPVTREQAAVFVLAGKEHAGYLPTACTTPVFGDVPASSPYCRFVEELSRRGVVGGCGGGNYCPASAVTREQMPVFVLKALDPAISPAPCGTPMFADVPASSQFCRWIEELARRGVLSGCGGGNYCPTDPVTREQMAVFIGVTFGLTLYGP